MSYVIEYGTGLKKKYPVRQKKPAKNKAVLMLASVAFALVLLCSLLKIDSIRKVILPGDPQTTEEAISLFVNAIKAGEGIYDSFSVFCKEVIASSIEAQ